MRSTASLRPPYGDRNWVNLVKFSIVWDKAKSAQYVRALTTQPRALRWSTAVQKSDCSYSTNTSCATAAYRLVTTCGTALTRAGASTANIRTTLSCMAPSDLMPQ